MGAMTYVVGLHLAAKRVGRAWHAIGWATVRRRVVRKRRKERVAREELARMREYLAPWRADLTDPNLKRIRDEKPAEQPAVVAAEPAKAEASAETWATEDTHIVVSVDPVPGARNSAPIRGQPQGQARYAGRPPVEP
jgi:hypothetical protein